MHFYAFILCIFMQTKTDEKTYILCSFVCLFVVCVAFLRDGKEPLKQSARILVKSARMDLSRRFPVLRIADYEVIKSKEKENNHIHDFF